MIRMKEDVIRHQYIITTNIRDDISTQYNIVICIYGIAYVYIGVTIVFEGYRDGGSVEGVGVNVLYAFSALISLYSNKISYIQDWSKFQLRALRLQC